MNPFRKRLPVDDWEEQIKQTRDEALALCDRYYTAWALVKIADDLRKDQIDSASEVFLRVRGLTEKIMAVPEPQSANHRAARKDLEMALFLYSSSAEDAVRLCRQVSRSAGQRHALGSAVGFMESRTNESLQRIRQSLQAAAERQTRAAAYWGGGNQRRIAS